MAKDSKLHISKSRAMRRAAKKNAHKIQGRSSGFARLEYSVTPSGNLLRRWEVKRRSR